MNYKKISVLLILSTIITLISLNIGMFWDNVLFAGKMGNAVYENTIFSWRIPIEFDPGHPPFLGTLMATGWLLFGKSLAISHWVMLPFIFGILWQIHSFVVYFIKDKRLQLFAFLLVAADPTLLSQLVLVNPEVIQLFFFFLALNAILKHNFYLKVIGLAFLGIVTYRGMMLCAGIFIIELFVNQFVWKNKLRSFISIHTFATYLIAALPALVYIVWRILEKGWIISSPMESWGNAWRYESTLAFINNILRNMLVLGQRFTDFGRLVPILFVSISLYLKRKTINWQQVMPLILISIFSTIVIFTVSLLINNTIGHRYFIPSYLSLALLSFMLLDQYHSKKLIYIVLVGSLLMGNLIVYPDKFAQGWDASLAHLPYWNLRKDALKYMDDNKLPIPQTASFFPNSTAIDNIDINGDMRSFRNFTGEEKYVFYSNVFNLSDEEFYLLNQNYFTIKTFKNCGVRIELKTLKTDILRK